MREELRVARRANVDAFYGSDTRVVQDVFRDRPEVEVASAHGTRSEARAIRARDLYTHLVTARADARPDRCRHPSTAERLDSYLEDPLDEAFATRVQQRKTRSAVPACERDRQAVGRHVQHRHARLVGPK